MDTKHPVGEANDVNEISITFPCNVFFVAGIRDFTLTLVKNLTGFSEQWAFRFQSVIDELCNNAIEHGSGSAGSITCLFRTVPGEFLEVVVEDNGTGEDTTAEDMRAMVEKKRNMDVMDMPGIRGRGLSHIVLPLVDKLVFEDKDEGGIRVHVFKFFKNT